MNYREERGGVDLFKEMFPLLEEHEEELNVLNCGLDVDLQMYVKAVAAKQIAIYTARQEGELVGYAVYWIKRHPHYNVLVADADVIFLRKDYRVGSTGIKLLRFSEDKLKEKGINVIVQRTKKHKDLGRLFKFLKYEHAEEVYIKEI